jgi:hypothetical protein
MQKKQSSRIRVDEANREPATGLRESVPWLGYDSPFLSTNKMIVARGPNDVPRHCGENRGFAIAFDTGCTRLLDTMRPMPADHESSREL